MGFESFVTTGACTKGNLPDRNQYDIHCPMMGGPDYKPNYVAASCIARQVAGSCSATTCGRKKIQLRKKPAAAKAEPNIYIEGEMYNNKKVAECAECGRQMPINARGCCSGCVARLKKAGTLDATYPAKRCGRRKATTITQIPAGHTSPANEGTPPDIGVTAGETAQLKEADVASKKQTGVCLECKREKTYVARRLCGKCYAANKKAGTLDAKYPAKGLQVDPVQEAFFSRDAIGAQQEKPSVKIVENKPLRVLISFEDTDVALGEFLQDWAKEDRRCIESQVLYVLDQSRTYRINGGQL